MTTFLSILPMLFAIPVMAWIFRIAAKFVARSTLGWRDAFVVVGVLFAMNTMLFLTQGMLEGVSAVFLRVALTVAFFCIVSWFLGPRCRRSDGHPGTFFTGVKVMGAVFALGMSVGVLMAFLGPRGGS